MIKFRYDGIDIDLRCSNELASLSISSSSVQLAKLSKSYFVFDWREPLTVRSPSACRGWRAKRCRTTSRWQTTRTSRRCAGRKSNARDSPAFLSGVSPAPIPRFVSLSLSLSLSRIGRVCDMTSDGLHADGLPTVVAVRRRLAGIWGRLRASNLRCRAPRSSSATTAQPESLAQRRVVRVSTVRHPASDRRRLHDGHTRRRAW